MLNYRNPQLTKGYLFQNRKMIFFLKIIDAIISLFFRKRSYPGQIDKILIIKPDHLGDMLLATPVFSLIKQKYPHSIIDIVINAGSEIILEDNPHIRNKIVVRHYKHNRQKISLIEKLSIFFQDYLKALKVIKKERYDAAVILRAYGFNLISLARLYGCRYIIGYPTGGSGGMLDYCANWEPGIHEIEHHLILLKAIGITANLNDLRYEIYSNNYNKNIIDNIQSDSKIAVIHPGAGDSRKTLRDEKWKEIISSLIKKGYSLIFTGIQSESLWIDSIRQNNGISLTGKLSIIDLAHLFKKASILVTADSLAAHLGGWSGIKTYVFYCGINDVKQWKPIGNNIIIIDMVLPCTPCFTGCSGMECMDIPLDIFENSVI